MDNAKIKLLLVALAAILATYLTQGTLAYYSTVGKVTNVVTSGDIQLVIREQTADGSAFPADGIYVIPGDVVGKKVTVENVCDHPFYLRVKLVNGTSREEISSDDVFHIDLNETDWTQHTDGYIYYDKILQPGETTAAVFTQVEIVGEQVNQNHVGEVLTLTVNAHAVQSENNPADYPWEASGWPAY